MKYIFISIAINLILVLDCAAQPACDAGKIQTGVISKPTESRAILTPSCQEITIFWKGQEKQTYIVNSTAINEATSTIKKMKESTAAVCDKNYNCSVILQIQPGHEITWTVQAVELKDGRTFYSYPLRGKIPSCNETMIVANKNLPWPGEVYLSETHIKPQLLIYPNPVTGDLTIKWSEEYQGPAKLIITDATGKAIKQMDVNKRLPDYLDRITVSNLSAGLYFMQVRMDNGKTMSTRFVKN